MVKENSNRNFKVVFIHLDILYFFLYIIDKIFVFKRLKHSQKSCTTKNVGFLFKNIETITLNIQLFYVCLNVLNIT